MDSLKVTDEASKAVAVAPRVSLDDIKAAIAARWDFTAKAALDKMGMPVTEETGLLSICLLQMKNGFMVIGKSAPASAENFSAELGRQFAYEDAVRQLWPLMGYALRDRLVPAAAAKALADKINGLLAGIPRFDDEPVLP